MSGEVDKLDTVVGILNDVIAIGLTPMGLIWKPLDNEVQGFYPSNTSDPPPLATLQAEALRALTFPHPNANYRKNSLIQFQNHLHDVIEGIDPDSQETAPEESVIRLAMFLALTLYRFAIKNEFQMRIAFRTEQYKNNLTNLAGWPTEHPFLPPCKRCLTICEGDLNKCRQSTSKLFTKVVHEFVLTQKVGYPDPHVAGILAAALLTDTAKNGLGMIRMLDQVQVITKRKWEVIMAQTLFQNTELSWKRIKKFLVEQTNTEHPQYSYDWARIIDHAYFMGLSPKENAFLATIFTSVIAHVQGNGVWKAEWTKWVPISEDAKLLGEALSEINQESLDEAQTAPGGADVFKRARELKRQKPGETVKLRDLENAEW